MVPGESNRNPLMEENSNPNYMQDEDEAEETLSFCDLPIYSNDTADWEKLSKEDQSLSSSSTSSSSSDQDLFEFFSEEWATSRTYPVGNIVFCGKLIPFREPVICKNEEKQEKPKTRGLFRWNSKWFSRQRSSKTKATKSRCMNKTNQPKLRLPGSSSPAPPVSEKCGDKVTKGGEKYGFSVRRVSIVTSPAKSRWHLLMFGLAKLPAEMELSDIRSRQSRRSPSALFRSSSDDEKVSGVKGLWGLIRTLGCGDTRHPDAVVKAQVGCIPSA